MEKSITIKTHLIWILSILVLSFYSMNSFADSDMKNQPSTAQLKAFVSSNEISQKEAPFQSDLNIYCLSFTQHGGFDYFNQALLDPMKTSSKHSDGTFNRYWLVAGCEPRLMGGTKSPLAHLVAENATDRMSYLVALQKYYLSKGDTTTFTQVINAKNSRGYTLLDYLYYLYAKNEFMVEEEKGINDFYKYLCDNGATFSIYDKKCPPEYLKILK